MEIRNKEEEALTEVQHHWMALHGYFSQKFILGCINRCEGKPVKNS